MKLYGYWRSSAAYRVRIALALKEIAYDSVPVHLVKDGGEQKSPSYTAKNPQKLVPLLELDNGSLISQSLAIIEYLDEIAPTPPLLPSDPALRAKARSIALAIACDIHPLNNLRVLQYLTNQCGVSDANRSVWYSHWVVEGFEAIEKEINGFSGPYALGPVVTLADLCIVPQVYNARRFNVTLDQFPRILAVEEACLALKAFQTASPENQPDAQ